ncbi:hypothetical protein [Oceanicaulis alexandrii]|mgnify:CR=1 FL=1|uniref:hypothetical protein n=1 Tax=Oceanicaulis alexandrii TaxID=153233 RepID=UPI003B5127FD
MATKIQKLNAELVRLEELNMASCDRIDEIEKRVREAMPSRPRALEENAHVGVAYSREHFEETRNWRINPLHPDADKIAAECHAWFDIQARYQAAFGLPEEDAKGRRLGNEIDALEQRILSDTPTGSADLSIQIELAHQRVWPANDDMKMALGIAQRALTLVRVTA